MNKPRQIVIHHSATKDSASLSWPEIRSYHIENNGWDDIGYHAGIEKYGITYETLLGRPWYVVGAHCPGANSSSLGFVFIGNFEDLSPPRTMLEEAAYRILAPWCLQFAIKPENIVGHRDLRPTKCPGQYFDLPTLRQIVERELRKI